VHFLKEEGMGQIGTTTPGVSGTARQLRFDGGAEAAQERATQKKSYLFPPGVYSVGAPSV
jgi:hypothetical protein